jgi:hypothetical protein
MVKGSKFSKESLAKHKKNTPRGKKHHSHAKSKSRAGIKKATKEERQKVLDKLIADTGRPRFMHEYPPPYLGSGRPKAFESPEDMLAAAKEYFEYCEKRPWYKTEWKDKGLQEIPVARVFTWDGLCIRIGVGDEYFRVFFNQLKNDDPQAAGFKRVIEWIRKCIYSNKFEGASSGHYNANLIAYDLGLRKDVPVNVGASGLTINIQSSDQGKLIEDVRLRLAEIDNENGTDTVAIEQDAKEE